DIGEGIKECEIVQWFVKPGDQISEFEKICEVQSDKATVEITSRFTGTIKELHYQVGEMAKVGKPIVNIETESASENHEGLESDENTVTSTIIQHSELKTNTFSANDKVLSLATPAVRRIAKEYKVDISEIKGTGKGARVTKDDVMNHVAKKTQSIVKPIASLPPQVPTTFEDKITSLSTIQKSMFKYMTRSLQIPHFGYGDEFILDNAIALRDMVNEYIAQSNKFSFKKITFMPILIKSFSVALQKFPILNACLVDADSPDTVKLKYRSVHNIGVAMDTPGGLLVPNVKNVQTKSIFDIAADLQRLQEDGKRNAIALSDIQDGTITLSNIGIIGGTHLSPVIFSQELCIAAIGKIQRLPRFEPVKDDFTGKTTDKVIAKHVIPVSFCADHRIIDGVTVARFSEAWKNLLENPALMSVELR
ncbi:5031_t:CDS:2, partial [Cetraspora pellucida]